MTKSSKYVVFSNGFVLTGFEIDDVAKSLADRYNTNEKKIKKRLIAGKAAKIKSFDDYHRAEQLSLKLAQYGLNCYVFSPELEGELDTDNQRFSEHTTFHTVTVENAPYASDPYSEMSVSQYDDGPSVSHSDGDNDSIPAGSNRREAIVVVVLILVSLIAYAFFAPN